MSKSPLVQGLRDNFNCSRLELGTNKDQQALERMRSRVLLNFPANHISCILPARMAEVIARRNTSLRAARATFIDFVLYQNVLICMRRLAIWKRHWWRVCGPSPHGVPRGDPGALPCVQQVWKCPRTMAVCSLRVINGMFLTCVVMRWKKRTPAPDGSDGRAANWAGPGEPSSSPPHPPARPLTSRLLFITR